MVIFILVVLSEPLFSFKDNIENKREHKYLKYNRKL